MAMKMKDWPEGMSREDARLFRRGLKQITRELGYPGFYRSLKAKVEDDSLSPEQRHELATELAFIEHCVAIMAGRPYSKH